MRGSRAGFTLVEMLLVLLVVGLMVAVGTPVYLRWVAKTEVDTAANLLAQEVSRVRTIVKRTDRPVVLSVSSGGSAVTSTRTLALQNVQSTGSLNLTFVPPFGTLAEGTSTPQSLSLVSLRQPDVSRTVSVVSLFGKVNIR